MKYLLTITILGSLLLSGCASTISAIRDEPIQQDPGKRTTGRLVSDETIETIALVNIDKADPGFKQTRISVVSFDGTVLIVGQVPNERLKGIAGDTVRNVRDVKQVYNELEISGPISLVAATSDNWLTTKVKAKMLGDESVPSSRIKVVTENGTVFLMGRVTNAEANRAVELVRTTYGVQRIVKVFNYIN
ncbi:BON domain-containing protein [Aestuariirhabdus litorea]|uniref:BON domain-containing protein n=1 Tax=Aestuariirhabdus litorea TaxID=2528527 RepID=A0A3P3VUQ3_9GAMM|nr:BON domain-containing protein [Aestuariirhabdus litorea]RRJ85356.1 BON domain-containing protein [Aestuariirhabdus litorea]RWW98580.1 BON domain-containing protein [Endozoicomonadaceae bacterium GTF-13]